MFSNAERIKETIEVLHVRNITADANYACGVEWSETFHISKASERAIGCWWMVDLARSEGLRTLLSRQNIPRLSAAMTTPSLNLTAITEVPVTIGDCVCVLGPVVWRYDAS